MEIISSEIINKDNTFQLVLKISSNNSQNKNFDEKELLKNINFHFNKERRPRLSGEERLKRIDERIDFLKQKLVQLENKQEKKQRIEGKIIKLTERKQWMENKINNNNSCQQQKKEESINKPTTTTTTSSPSSSENYSEKPHARRGRCNKLKDQSERKEKKHREFPKEKRIECIERRINKMGEMVLNEKISEERRQKLQNKIEFLSEKLSNLKQETSPSNPSPVQTSSVEMEAPKIEVNNTGMIENNTDTENTNRRRHHNRHNQQKDACRRGKLQSKEFLSGRIEHLKQRKQNIENKLNEMGTSNENLKNRLLFKLEKIEKRISFLTEKLESI